MARRETRAAAILVIIAFCFSSAPVLAAGGAVQSSPMIRVAGGSVSSTNWSGYAVNGTVGSVSAVQASWTVPSVTCPKTGSTYAAVWVGIDGFQSNTVEQTGTDSDCVNGVPSYYAWYEFYPLPSFKIGAAIHPGDVMGAKVWYSSGTFKIRIVDLTTRQAFAKAYPVPSAARSSGEFVVEAPLTCSLFGCRLTSLSDFGTVGFGSDYTGVRFTCGLVMNGVHRAIGGFSSVQQMTMVSQSNPNQVKAQPSPLTPDGQAFTVQWVSAGP